MAAPNQDHWLVRPGTIRLLWIAFGFVLTALVLADLVVRHHSNFFGLDATFGFSAWYGFGACIVLVLFAKVQGAILKRPDNYYDD